MLGRSKEIKISHTLGHAGLTSKLQLHDLINLRMSRIINKFTSYNPSHRSLSTDIKNSFFFPSDSYYDLARVMCRSRNRNTPKLKLRNNSKKNENTKSSHTRVTYLSHFHCSHSSQNHSVATRGRRSLLGDIRLAKWIAITTKT